ncbi:MAG: glycosyltransferase family 1 protein [Chloroflexi bacterium]|nr:MAG: glycosyltransferase family 1 protein [Chloroflexota bacterium]
MHVVIDAQLVSTAQSYRGAGVSNYSRHLLQSLGRWAENGTDKTLTAFLSDPNFQVAGVRLQRTPSLFQDPLLRIGWEQTIFPIELHRQRADLVHGLVNVLPLATCTPGVVTVHDLSFLRVPEKLPAAKRGYLTRMCRASVQRARHVIAVSHQTADDVMHYFGVPAGKISVIHNGVAEQFRPGDPAAVAMFRQQHGLPERFALYVGTLEPRKNLTQLLRAFAAWLRVAQPEDRSVRLVLAGAKGWYYNEIFKLVDLLGLAGQVDFPGFIPDEELPDWYRAAEFFVYPSLLEGFGLPVLEAMACGTPVLCSRASSLLEVAGDSALTFPAGQDQALIAAIQALVTQPALRAELRRRGLARAQCFTWQRTAAATLDVYDRIYRNANRQVAG